jgi:hypothetical protein
MKNVVSTDPGDISSMSAADQETCSICIEYCLPALDAAESPQVDTAILEAAASVMPCCKPMFEGLIMEIQEALDSGPIGPEFDPVRAAFLRGFGTGRGAVGGDVIEQDFPQEERGEGRRGERRGSSAVRPDAGTPDGG